MCGSADPGDNVFYCNDGDQYAVYTAGGRADRVYGADPDLRRIYRMCDRSVSYINGRSAQGADLCDRIPGPAADRGQPDLPEGGWRVCRTSVHMGAGGGYDRRQRDGRCRHADLHPDRICSLYTVQNERV